MTDVIKTGIILPRDYGIIIKNKNQKHFISPLKYVIASLMLETKDQINFRFENFANENSYNLNEIKSEFRKGVKRKEKSTSILNVERRSTIFDVKNYSDLYSAKVQSKSNKAGIYYDSQVSGAKLNNYSEFTPAQSRCTCSDSFWVDVKRRSLNCIHTSALELALYEDNKSRESSQTNITALMPKERSNQIILPFKLTTNSDLDSLIMQSLWAYYVENQSQFNVNKFLLDNMQIYSQGLVNILENNYDRGEFGAIRQKEEEINKEDLTKFQKEFYGSSKALEKRIVRKLNDLRFEFQGYGLEFKDTNNEFVARRFRNGNETYSVGITKNMPPIMIRKFLGAKTNLFEKSMLTPDIFNNQSYISIDDSTRRESLTKVIIPGRGKLQKYLFQKY